MTSLARVSARTVWRPGRLHTRRLSFSYPASRKLDQIVRMQSFARLSPGSCAEVWQTYHNAAQEHSLGWSLSRSRYAHFVHNARRYPMFVFPLLRPEQAGYVSLLAQTQDAKYVLFTYLQEYRDRPDRAQPRLVFTVYDELVADKGLALVRAEVVHHPQIRREDAWRLLHLWQQVYADEDDAQLLRQFYERPREFDYERVVAAAAGVASTCPPPPTFRLRSGC
ncbi:hypothetical protein CDCA_CDCA12G3341 [Cyanidium caldarium]|uniref:Uncharacterized protein n=1 Tax=Cyanidium caldarium TaxID=2771 RepID=A0AAV9IYV3_CYACA|nr:hypothetical protein CDCA_CDCA12G3341 [Cyanidium caldarium]